MDFAKTLQQLKSLKAIAVLRAPSASGAEDACRAMGEGGVKIMEITTTTTDWLDAIARVAKLSGLVTGVGTLVSPAQVKQAKDAGATFGVSPGFDREIADECLKQGLPFFPGIATPTELMTAQKHPAVAALKLFPAGELGGVKYLKALKGPFPKAQFVPTGGISKDNAREYLDAGALAIGLSSICKGEDIKASAWGKITEESKALMAKLA